MIAGTAHGMIDHTIVEIVFGRIKATPVNKTQSSEIRVIENRVELTSSTEKEASALKKDWKDANLVFTQLCKLCSKNEEKAKSEKYVFLSFFSFRFVIVLNITSGFH